jgi:hypothetical protein
LQISVPFKCMKTSSRTARSVRFGTIPILNGNMYGESYRASHQSADIVADYEPLRSGLCAALWREVEQRPSIDPNSGISPPVSDRQQQFLPAASNGAVLRPRHEHSAPAIAQPRLGELTGLGTQPRGGAFHGGPVRTHPSNVREGPAKSSLTPTTWKVPSGLLAPLVDGFRWPKDLPGV